MKDPLLQLFASQLERIKNTLRPTNVHSLGPKRPDLAMQESGSLSDKDSNK